ncbi:MAG: ROK family protein [Gemmatimonadaceae bacterium]
MRLAGAVDIGATNTKIGVVGEDGRIIRRATVSTKAGAHQPELLIDAIAAELKPMLDAMSDERNQVAALGVAIAGFLDREHTMMIANANLVALCDFPLRRAFEERFELPCHLEVDSNASTVADYRYGKGRGASRLLGITVGTGVGGGVIIGGRLIRFTGECVGDPGHVIVTPNGRQCTCGAKGCLEAEICSAAVAERAGRRTAAEVIVAAKKGEQFAVDAFAETGRLLGLGLASLSPIFAPDTIVVGGGVASVGDILLEPTRASYAEQAGDEFRGKTSIVGSAFDGWEGIVGAGSLALSPLE